MQNEFFKPLDNWDNGIQIAEPGMNIPQEIKIWNHPDIKSPYQDERFFEAVDRAKWLIPLLVDSMDHLENLSKLKSYLKRADEMKVYRSTYE
jgi:uncharacterized UPF0160 family protein